MKNLLFFIIIYTIYAILSRPALGWEKCRSADNRIRIEPVHEAYSIMGDGDAPYRVTIMGVVHENVYWEDFEEELGITFSQEKILEAHYDGPFIQEGFLVRKVTVKSDEDWIICQFLRDHKSPHPPYHDHGIYLVFH